MRDLKTLTQWLELDYYRRPRRIWRVYRAVLWGVLLACAAGLTAILVGQQQSVFEAGPVSRAHAMFHQDCNRCHTQPFEQIHQFVSGEPTLRAAMDTACVQCHDGPVHHGVQSRQPNCASCHAEHRGTERLAHVPDQKCTACHEDLKGKGLREGAVTTYQDVRSFAPGGHPQFALLRGKSTDPGTIRFNHQIHLPAGGVRTADGTVQKLQCQSCHVVDAERRYMEPVRYEQHCAECHPLTVAVAGRTSGPKVLAAAEQYRSEPAPHRDPATVRAVLRERLVQFVKGNAAVLTPLSALDLERPLPSFFRSRQGPADPWSWVEGQLAQSERILFEGAAGCLYCHQAAGWRQKDQLPEYALSQVPTRWFQHSRFSHNSHRSLACGECHAAAVSTRSHDVLMPGVENCQQCHSPAVQARSDCTTCHQYHDRGKRFFGTLTIDACLGRNGKMPEQP